LVNASGSPIPAARAATFEGLDAVMKPTCAGAWVAPSLRAPVLVQNDEASPMRRISSSSSLQVRGISEGAVRLHVRIPRGTRQVDD
jgi:hypothetical protein